MSRQTDMQRVIDAAVQAGFRVVAGRKHHKLVWYDGRSIPFSNSPSDGNAHRQVWRDVRRIFGIELKA